MSQDNRPRWSFSWLLRIQRTGRNRIDPPADGDPSREPVIRRWAFIIVIGILLIEVAVGVWLGYLPR